MVRSVRITFAAGAAACCIALSGCPSPLLARIKQEIAKFPFTATSYTFSTQWGNPSPQYSFGAAVVKADTAGYVYVADNTFRIRKFDSTGAIQKTYDVPASGGLNAAVRDMAFDASGNMYVATYATSNGTSQILKFDVSGNNLNWTPSATITTATALAVDSSGNLYVVDSGKTPPQVMVFSPAGTLITSWTGKGNPQTGASDFNTPTGIAIDYWGKVYVIDYTTGGTIRKFDPNGGLYATSYSSFGAFTIGDPTALSVDASSSPTFYIADSLNSRIVKTDLGSNNSTFGSSGAGNGQFTTLAGVAVDSSGNVYVTDSPNGTNLGDTSRVQKFNSAGAWTATWGGTALAGNGQFNAPDGAAYDSSGNLYVVDVNNHRVQKFDPTGAYLGQWGTPSTYTPALGSIAVDSAGNVYLPDTGGTPSIHMLDSSLNPVRNIGAGTLSSPEGVALDSAGNVYVADANKEAVFIFDPNGYAHSPASFGTFGAADGQFELPVGIAVDSGGNIYVADLDIFQAKTNLIQKFDKNGNFVKSWGTRGAGDGQIYYAIGLAIDKYDNVYATDFVNRRVEKFDSNGTFLTKFGSVGVGNGTFGWPFNVAVNSTGTVAVADLTNDLVQLMTPSP